MLLGLIQAQQVPFFTNDLAGILKVLAFIAAIVAPSWAFMWRILQGPLSKADDKLSHDINEVGARVNKMETYCTELHTRLETLFSRIDRHDFKIDAHDKDMVEIRAKLEHLYEASNINKIEIIDAFQRRTDALASIVQELKMQLGSLTAVMNDRQIRKEL